MAELGDLYANRFGRTCRIKDGIHLKELIENRKFEFTLDAPEFEDQSEKECKLDSVFEYNDFSPFINWECVNEEDDPDFTPFEKIQKKMTPITKDGKIHKLILRHGSGKVIEPSSVVYYHYNAYLESIDGLPFDSNRTRGERPHRLQLGVGETYIGMEKSLLSMKVGEKSQFLIDPSYAFGEMGVPPRIPPDATILLELELLKVVDCGAIVENDDVLQEGSNQFSDNYKKAKGFHALGNDYFQQKNYTLALENYRKAERLLQCRMDNELEEEQYIKLLFKIYVNKCVVYNNPKMKAPEKVCSIAKEAFYYCPKLAQKSAKLFFCVGKAQMALGTFDKAREYLQKSLALEPHNKDINDALAELEQKKKKYYEHEKITYQKIFGHKPAENKRDSKKPDDEFVSVLKEELADFAKGSSNRFQLPPGLTQEERKLCQKSAEELGLTYEDVMICGKRNIAIIK